MKTDGPEQVQSAEATGIVIEVPAELSSQVTDETLLPMDPSEGTKALRMRQRGRGAG